MATVYRPNVKAMRDVLVPVVHPTPHKKQTTVTPTKNGGSTGGKQNRTAY